MHKVEKIMQTMYALLRRTPKLNAIIERSRTHAYAPDELPAVSLRQGAEQVETENSTLPYYSPTFEIAIDLFVRNDVAAHHEEWLNKVRAEISLLIELDTTLGLDYVIDIMEVGSTEPSAIDSADEIMTQTVLYQCHYRRLRSNPNVIEGA